MYLKTKSSFILIFASFLKPGTNLFHWEVCITYALVVDDEELNFMKTISHKSFLTLSCPCYQINNFRLAIKCALKWAISERPLVFQMYFKSTAATKYFLFPWGNFRSSYHMIDWTLLTPCDSLHLSLHMSCIPQIFYLNDSTRTIDYGVLF